MNFYICSRYILVLFKLAQISSTLQSLVEPVELGELEELRRKRRRGSGFAEEKKNSSPGINNDGISTLFNLTKNIIDIKKKISRLLTLS